ncbi:alpha/beta hydrolase family protein [Gordonia hongkongensis]|uniref:Acyl-CoA:diacylglycerol acyltransferase n=1 Tax=Gordonia hongkongensis TaxID=1701090 RepID=A0AAX3T7A3_9ACTN|nr:MULTISPECIES: alpha/beta hydrolase family protein [Gordonia]QIK46175.1 esterase family protein [Gordonia terrae]UPG68227.1 esterase family protein [Gordonia hongkongensis]WFP24850.1 alpha/beta hydrolase family protein [Gordonia hongkongensis]
MSRARRRLIRVFAAALVAGPIVSGTQGIVSAAPVSAPASVISSVAVGPQRHDLVIRSAAMGRDVPVSVLHPAHSRSRGTLYLLDGGGHKTAISDWIREAGADRYFRDKDVNAVLPGGQGAFYTNWQHDDATFGRPQWETFLTVELPSLIDGRFHGNGRNAIAGLSVGGQAAFTLATRRPGLYTGVGSISGCPFTTGPVHEGQIRAAIIRDGGDPTNMWGPWNAPGWADHDPGRRLPALVGKRVFIASGTGAPGPLDQRTRLDPGRHRGEKIATGAVLENSVNACSNEFARRMRSEGLQPVVHFRAIGTHAWPYWADDLPVMFAALAPGL